MAQPIIPGINLGAQAEAMAGAQSMTFTATDRQLIKELAGEVDKSRTFKELFFKDNLNSKVENEESTANPEIDIKTLEGRRQEHREMLKHAAVTFQKERVNLSDAVKTEAAPAPVVITGKPVPPASQPEPQSVAIKPVMNQATAAIVKELNLDPSELLDKFALEEKDLHNLIHRIRELHLKRLLCGSRREFEVLSGTIKEETLKSGRPESRDWLEKEIDKLTKSAAEYKLNLIQSMQSLHYDDENEKNSRWLQKEIANYS